MTDKDIAAEARKRLDERRAAHEEQQRRQRITKLVAWIRRKGGK